MDRELPVSAWAEWKIIEKIGEGSYGKVYKAERCEKGKSFYSAIKIISIPGSKSEWNSVYSETSDERSTREYFQNLVEECIQEVSTMEYFRGNSHIVSVEDFKVMEYLDEVGWDIYIRMEYLTSFMDYCTEKNLTESEVIHLGADLSKALEYCRKLKIIHRDIKPENIFVSRFGDFKIGDFGIARELERSMSGLSKKGTYSYMAPEMYRGEQYDGRVDIYSLGLVLYKLMNHNRLPFMNLEKQFITYRDKENALTRRMSGEIVPKPADAGDAFSAIILKACAYDPGERYQTPEEFHRNLEDLIYGRERAEEATSLKEALEQSSLESSASELAALKSTTPESEELHKLMAEIENQEEIPETRPEEIPRKANTRPGNRRRAYRRKKSRMLPWVISMAVIAVATAIIIVICFRLTQESREVDPAEDLVHMLEDDYPSKTENSENFAEVVQNIKDHATTIVNNLHSYDWIGNEGDRIRYYNHDTGELMKALVYPSSSGDGVYEEYYYWGEEMFFAYIWTEKQAELYYYDNGELIRWIDADGKCHDNETDNEEYVTRGEKYWKQSLEELS